MEGDQGARLPNCTVHISIHALRVEGDITNVAGNRRAEEFLSTPSGWRATCRRHKLVRPCDISIHALRVEGDLICTGTFPRTVISIHALRVEGDAEMPAAEPFWHGISIHALRVEGDSSCKISAVVSSISIHALRVEGDSASSAPIAMPAAFLSTPSGWRATIEAVKVPARCRFLSTPSGWRATSPRRWRLWRCENFYPRPPGGGRHKAKAARNGDVRFLSTPSGWRATGKNGDGTEEA